MDEAKPDFTEIRMDAEIGSYQEAEEVPELPPTVVPAEAPSAKE